MRIRLPQEISIGRGGHSVGPNTGHDRIIQPNLNSPTARGILIDAVHHDTSGSRRSATGRRGALVLHSLVPRRFRQHPLAHHRLRVPAYDAALVFSGAQLVWRTLDVLARRRPGAFTVD